MRFMKDRVLGAALIFYEVKTNRRYFLNDVTKRFP